MDSSALNSAMDPSAASSLLFSSSILSTFLASLRSVGTACAMASVGIYLHRRNFIVGEGKRTLALVSQQVTIPCFLFTKVVYCNQDWSTKPCPNVMQHMSDIWPLLFWPVYVVGTGLLVGYAAARVAGTPRRQIRSVLAACAFGNSTGLPITLLTVIHANFPDTTELGAVDPTLFLSVYLLLYPVLQWGVGGWLLAPEEEALDTSKSKSKTGPTVEKEADGGLPQEVSGLRRQTSLRQSTARNVLNNRISAAFYRSSRRGIFETDASLYISNADLIGLGMRRSLRGSHLGGDGGIHGGIQLPISPSPAAAAAKDDKDDDEDENGEVGAAPCIEDSPPRIPPAGLASHSGASPGLIPPTMAGALEGASTTMPPSSSMPRHVRVNLPPSEQQQQPQQQQQLSEWTPLIPADQHVHDDDTLHSDHSDLGTIATAATVDEAPLLDTLRQILGRCLQPPVVGALLGLLVAGIPALRGVFVDLVNRADAAPLEWLFDGLYAVGQAAVPLNMMILGCNLSLSFAATATATATGDGRGRKGGDEHGGEEEEEEQDGGSSEEDNSVRARLLSDRTMAAIVVGKMAVMPLVGIASCMVLDRFFWDIPDDIDSSFYLVTMIVFITPTANNVMVMVELSGSGSKEGIARVIGWQYAAAPILLSLSVTLVVGVASEWRYHGHPPS